MTDMKEPIDPIVLLGRQVNEMIDAGWDIHHAIVGRAQASQDAGGVLGDVERLQWMDDLLDAVAGANATHRDLLFTLAERVIEQERIIDRLVRRIEALEARDAAH